MRLVNGAYVGGTVLGDVRLGPGVSIWYGAVVRGDMAPITLGEATNIQDNCVLHCDPGMPLEIGRFVTVGHLAMIHGRRIGDRCLIGIGSMILANAEIGDGSLIAAGALVRESQIIPPRSIVVGVPGRIIGQTTDRQVEEFEERAKRYLLTAKRHAEGRVRPEDMTEYAV